MHAQRSEGESKGAEIRKDGFHYVYSRVPVLAFSAPCPDELERMGHKSQDIRVAGSEILCSVSGFLPTDQQLWSL